MANSSFNDSHVENKSSQAARHILYPSHVIFIFIFSRLGAHLAEEFYFENT